MWLEILVAELATNFKDLVAKAKNLVALAPVLGATLRPDVHISVTLHSTTAVIDSGTWQILHATKDQNVFEYDTYSY